MDSIKNTLHGLIEGYSDMPVRKVQIDKDKSQYEQALHKLAGNIVKSEQIRTEIIKNIGKESPEETLLRSLRCISLMIGDEVFYNTTAGKITRS